jgi:hypothetical protein
VTLQRASYCLNHCVASRLAPRNVRRTDPNASRACCNPVRRDGLVGWASRSRHRERRRGRRGKRRPANHTCYTLRWLWRVGDPAQRHHCYPRRPADRPAAGAGDGFSRSLVGVLSAIGASCLPFILCSWGLRLCLWLSRSFCSRSGCCGDSCKFQAFRSDQERDVNIFTIELQAKRLGLLHDQSLGPVARAVHEADVARASSLTSSALVVLHHPLR